ncbi:MAG: glycosyltransferase family 4 protein [Limisphaerales bacterium]
MHIIGGLKVGGAETALLKLVRASSGGRYRHSVVSLTPEGEMGQGFKAAGIELQVLDFRRSPISSFVQLVKLIRVASPDIVQTWMYHSDLLGGIAARLAGARNVIWGIRTTDVSAGGKRVTRLVKWCSARLSRIVPAAIICVAEAALQRHAEAGYDRTRMEVIPNGFDLDTPTVAGAQRTPLRSHWGFSPTEIVVGTLGRFAPAKDHRNFVIAAGLVARRCSNVRFIMVGRGLDKENSELAEWINQTCHAERFVLLGERSDVTTCLSAMDVFCLSSRTEGFPNAVGEAMAMGLPCVVTDVGDAAVLVGETGIVVPSQDPEALAQGLARFVELPEDARACAGQAGRSRVESCFGLNSTRAKFEMVYDRLMGEVDHLQKQGN